MFLKSCVYLIPLTHLRLDLPHRNYPIALCGFVCRVGQCTRDSFGYPSATVAEIDNYLLTFIFPFSFNNITPIFRFYFSASSAVQHGHVAKFRPTRRDSVQSHQDAPYGEEACIFLLTLLILTSGLGF